MKHCLRCQKEFEPHIRFQRQKYCSEKCQQHVYNKQYRNTIDVSKYYKKSNCILCGKFRRLSRINQCQSCRNRAAYGFTRKAIIGTCISCQRGPLTLSNKKCRSCVKYGKYTGTPYKISQGEMLLRKCVEISYPGQRIVFKYRPQWLKTANSKQPYELDVALPNLKIAFEYNGRPHTDPKHPGYYNATRNDRIKANICAENEWVLIHITSTDIVQKHSRFERVLNALDDYHEFDIIRKAPYQKCIKVAAMEGRTI